MDARRVFGRASAACLPSYARGGVEEETHSLKLRITLVVVKRQRELVQQKVWDKHVELNGSPEVLIMRVVV